MERYHHTQHGIILPIMLAAGLLVIVVGIASSGSVASLLVVLAVLVVTAVLFASLTVTIGDDFVKLAFGPGLLHKRVLLADIASCAVVQNPWWYGWGIRLTPHGWLYNVAGRGAVEITLKNGRRFRVGTDEPERLCRALQQALG
ncbi:MAG TPA: hypothetical protein VFX76_17180 [Roseiflexaceae bacterium]|nr:hypothetical protein [Roseiflexaceae bacterium]